MKRVLKNNKKTNKFLDKLPIIYLIAIWAKCGVRSYRFSGNYDKKVNPDGNVIYIPLVWDYDDHNGTCDNWYLRPINLVTTGYIISWTQSKNSAKIIADAINYKNGWVNDNEN